MDMDVAARSAPLALENRPCPIQAIIPPVYWRGFRYALPTVVVEVLDHFVSITI